jgi:hypothetical protein
MQQEETRLLQNKMRKKDEKIERLYRLPPYERGYQFLTGIQIALNSMENIKLDYTGTIFSNQNTLIQKASFCESKFFIVEKANTGDLTHEVFVGKVLNSLLTTIPNFYFTFGLYDNKLLTEFIEGETLLSYIRSPNFTLPDFITILLQICLALQIAQRRYYFVHNDLTPWNIMLQKGPVREVYYTLEGITYQFCTTLVPIIIDFGRSHIIYENKHWGSTINPFSFSSIQDIVSLLVTSLYEISEKVTNSDVVLLGNFLCKKGFREQLFRNMGEMRAFLRNAKKYAVLVGNKKGELEKCNPLHLIRYIAENMKHICTMRAIKEEMKNLSLLQGHAEQVYYYLITNDEEKKLQSFFRVFDSVNEYSKEEALTSLYETAVKLYLQQKDEIDKKYNNAISKLAELDLVETKEEGGKIGTQFHITEDTFLFPNKILEILNRKEKGADYSTIRFYARKMYRENLKALPNELPEQIQIYKKDCETILKKVG